MRLYFHRFKEDSKVNFALEDLYTEKNDFAERSKILLDTVLKIILFQQNCSNNLEL